LTVVAFLASHMLHRGYEAFIYINANSSQALSDLDVVSLCVFQYEYFLNPTVKRFRRRPSDQERPREKEEALPQVSSTKR